MTPAREPVAYASLARVLVVVAARFGLDLSTDELLAVLAAVEVVLGVVTRSRTSPATPAPKSPDTQTGTTTSGS